MTPELQGARSSYVGSFMLVFAIAGLRPSRLVLLAILLRRELRPGATRPLTG